MDRFALVHRHLPDCRKADVLSPFTVGNGEFAFTVDVTGLQTLAAFYEQGIPLVTQSQWGWHTVPNTKGFRRSQTWEYMDTYDRVVPYASIMRSEAAEYLRSNPHRLNLGRIAFRKADSAFSEIQVSDISEIDQVLDIWTGKIHSFFVLDGKKITVQTCVHPDLDQIAVSVRASAPAVPAICFDFPYGSVQWGKNASDWDNPDRHTSSIIEKGNDYVTIERQLDSTRYYVYIRWNGNARLKTTGKHTFVLTNPDSRQLEFTCRFSPENEMTRENVTTTVQKSENFWRNFWLNGGAVDLSESRHPQALELERRIVLSQYLTAIQCSGSLPPQETGLTVNSWFGKFHLEMHWWHAVHFVLWGRPEMLENSLDWYTKILPRARKKALLQGYEGVRWPKMTSPDGLDSPSSVGVFLVWQQPHPIYYAELLYRSNPDDRILQQYKDIVFQTADFMASFAHWEEKFNRYVLGPPLIPAQEIYKPDKTMNPAFELSYWAFGLKTAQKWRERLGLAREEKWDHVLGHLAPLPANNGFFQNTETAQNTFQDVFNRNDHPTLLGAYGMLPNDNIDVEMMRRTLEQVMASWNWERTWGWDYPLTAMTAARVGRPDLAIQALLMDVPKNTYLNNGHNHQSERLPLYLPGNGGLLTAVAMMAAGWDGAPEKQTPGFPQDGEWTVKYEGLSPLP
ncbi:glycoside hydrolase family 65 [candidate division KSB1 bacterium]|nr:glycoside hydrolase family 65 [candidate division KSB1 bacterium]